MTMKTQINLLHADMQPRLSLSFPQQLMLVLIVTGLVCVLVVTNLWFDRVDAERELQINKSVQKQLTSQLQSVAREYQQLSDNTDYQLQIEGYTQQIEELERQLTSMQLTDSMDAGDVSELLSSLDSADVPGLWLTQMMYVQRHLLLTGNLTDSTVLPQWLGNIEHSAWFDERVVEQVQLVAGDESTQSQASAVSQFILVEQGFNEVIEQAKTTTQRGPIEPSGVPFTSLPIVNAQETKP